MQDSHGSSLHFLAKQAKIRLQAKHEKEQRKEIIARSFFKSREDIAYKTVEKMMEGQEVTTNPIGRIIDDLFVVKVDDEVNKQRMVLQTSKWYKQLKDRYVKEKITK